MRHLESRARFLSTDRDMTRSTQPGDEPKGDGPLTRLVDEQVEQRRPVPLGRDLPGPPAAQPTGREDYASGTSEHDDDGDV